MKEAKHMRKFLRRTKTLIQSKEDQRTFVTLVNAVLDDGVISVQDRDDLVHDITAKHDERPSAEQ